MAAAHNGNAKGGNSLDRFLIRAIIALASLMIGVGLGFSSFFVKAAIGEEIDNETLGGATTHCEISGVTDSKFPNDEACLEYIRRHPQWRLSVQMHKYIGVP